MGRNNSLHLHAWDARTLKHLRSFGRFRVGGSEARIAADGRTIFYPHGGWDGTYGVLLDARTGAQKAQFRLPRAGVSTGGDINNRFLAWAQNDFIEMRSLQDGRVVEKLRYKVKEYYPTRPRFSPDGRQLAWIGSQGVQSEGYANRSYGDALIVYSMSKRRVLLSRQLIGFELWWTSVSNTKRACVLGRYWTWAKSRRGNAPLARYYILVFNLSNGKQIFKLPMRRAHSDSVRISPDGKWLAVMESVVQGSSIRHDHVRVFDLSTGRLNAQWRKGYTSTFAFSHDSRTLYLEPPTRQFKLKSNGTWQPPQQQKGLKYL